MAAWNRSLPDERNRCHHEIGIKPTLKTVAIIVTSAIIISATIGLLLYYSYYVNSDAIHRPNTIINPKEIVNKTQNKTQMRSETTLTNASITKNKTYHGRVIVSENIVTNGNVIITTRVAENGEILRRIGKIRHRIFQTASDELLAMAIQAKAGSVMPPMPPLTGVSNEDFMESLENPIIVMHDDSPDVAELKRKVIAARAEMKTAIANGFNFTDVLREFELRHNDSAQITQEVRREYRKMINEDDPEAAETFRQKANKMLEAIGSDPVNAIHKK